MATLTTYPKGEVIANGSGANAAGYPAQTVLVGTYDAARLNAATGDVVQVVKVPAGCKVREVYLEVVTPDAGGGTVAVGMGASAFVAANAVSAATLVEGDGAGLGAFASAADTIDLTVATAGMTTLKVNVYAAVTIVG